MLNVSGKRDKTMSIEAKGGGIGLLDADGDGLLDLYVINGNTFARPRPGPAPSDRLYRNNGDGTFVDVTAAAGLGDTTGSMGCAAADVDNDGDQDLYLTNYGPNRLYRNEGGGRFVDVTAAAGLAGKRRWSTGAAFADFDGDGDLDLYVANYVDFDPAIRPDNMPYQVWKGLKIFHGPNAYHGEPDELYRNEGNGTFTDVTAQYPAIANARLRFASGLIANLTASRVSLEKVRKALAVPRRHREAHVRNEPVVQSEAVLVAVIDRRGVVRHAALRRSRRTIGERPWKKQGGVGRIYPARPAS